MPLFEFSQMDAIFALQNSLQHHKQNIQASIQSLAWNGMYDAYLLKEIFASYSKKFLVKSNSNNPFSSHHQGEREQISWALILISLLPSIVKVTIPE